MHHTRVIVAGAVQDTGAGRSASGDHPGGGTAGPWRVPPAAAPEAVSRLPSRGGPRTVRGGLVPSDLHGHKSSHSEEDGDNCVENAVADEDGDVAIRNSTRPQPVVRTSRAAFTALVTRLRTGHTPLSSTAGLRTRRVPGSPPRAPTCGGSSRSGPERLLGIRRGASSNVDRVLPAPEVVEADRSPSAG
ncbi:DUF397 domain-containing protein [Streptomyces sp. TE5632]